MEGLGAIFAKALKGPRIALAFSRLTPAILQVGKLMKDEVLKECLRPCEQMALGGKTREIQRAEDSVDLIFVERSEKDNSLRLEPEARNRSCDRIARH